MAKQARGFTLIEILVVVSVIALLAAILLPVIMMIQNRARETQCKASLRSMGVGLHQYVHFWDDYYPYYGGHRTPWDPNMYFTWRDIITPFITTIDIEVIDGPKEYDFTFNRGNGIPELFTDPSPGTGSGRYFGSSRIFFRRWREFGGPEVAGHMHSSEVAFPNLTPVVAPASQSMLNGDGSPNYAYNTYMYSIGFTYRGLIFQANRQHLECIDWRHGGRANVLYLDLHIEAYDEADPQDRIRLSSLWNTFRVRDMPWN